MKYLAGLWLCRSVFRKCEFLDSGILGMAINLRFGISILLNDFRIAETEKKREIFVTGKCTFTYRFMENIKYVLCYKEIAIQRELLLS